MGMSRGLRRISTVKAVAESAEAQGTYGDERPIEHAAGRSDNEAARNKARHSKGLAHNIDILDETMPPLVTSHQH